MKKSLLLSSAAILLFGMAKNFDGQEKSPSHRQLPGGGDTVIARQSKMAQAPFFSRQEPNRWATDQTLPDQHRMTKPMGHQNDRTHATMSWRTPAQHELSAWVDTAWVRHYASELASGDDAATAIAVDGSGNVYVTGATASYYSDFATIKYTSAGVQQWVSRYNELHEHPNALVVDASGNVYVTGHQGYHALFPATFLTIKYNSNGVAQWTARYGGSGGSLDDAATALAVDASGNVYVTGVSGGVLATVKYDAAGVVQWVRGYSWPGSDYNYANALAVDASGSVYVAGKSWVGSNYNFMTIKYDSTGTEQWVAHYSGSENLHGYTNSLVIDASSNVYVAGESAGDFATIKYNSAGVQQWMAHYNGPANAEDYATAVVVDVFGNVYVTGWSENSGTEADFATVKYNSDGVQQWVARYSGADNDWDWKAAVAVDASGNVYVTGTSVGSGTGDDFATIKYNSAGVQQWIARYNGPGNADDRVAALAVDASGNVYVTGSSEGNDRSVYTTIKYVQTPVSVEDEELGKPRAYDLSQNYPNPFNPTTTIEFTLPKASLVTLKIYDLLGNEVATLVAEKLPAGKHQRVWEAKGLASGVYLYRLEAGEFVQTRKLVLLR